VTGESPYLGNRFSLTALTGNPVRIVVVGKERGGDESNISMTRRGEIVRGFVRRGEPTKHLLGTFLAARMILTGDAGQAWKPSVDVSGESVHISECFALVNSVACSCKERASVRKASATTEMRRNCSSHLSAMMRILDPTVIVAQGNTAHSVLQSVITGVPEKPLDALLTVDLDHRPILLGSFSHPSPPGQKPWWRSDLPYFRDVVAPALRNAHEALAAANSSLTELT
jgi:hypothetical protein